MSQQLQITGGAKVRSLEGVITGTSGVLSSVPLGAANGVATLDSGGKVPVSQLPSSVVTYLGTWNAATNTPTLVNGTGDAGDLYICNVAGTVNFGAGPIAIVVGDWVLYGSGTWQKSSGQNGTVTSVAASITGNSIGITGSPISTAGTLAFAFAGNSNQYINGSGNLTTFPTLITEAQTLITDVYNETGATLTKGTVVYINGGHGNLPTVTKALASSDATSAQTYGVVQSDITNMNNGHVVVIGSLGDLDTQAYANGTILYLSSTTAGAWTSTKQYAPAHLVYVGIVVRSHPTQGVVEIKIQNGYELDELHNVSAQSPLNNQGIFYNTSTSLWENKSIATALGYTPIGGSGSSGQVAFFNGGSTTLGGSSNLYWDNSTSRLGIGTNTPNASLGIVNASSTGIQVRTSDSANQYQANIYYDASYGMVYGYNRLGSGTASNLSFYNSLGGFISVPESSNNNIGFNTLNPQGLAGATVYDFTSLNTNVELRLHNSSTGYTSSDGSYIRVTSSALVIANAETSKSILINNGGNGVVTIDGTNKVAIGDIGVIPMTQQLTVVGSIEAYGGSIYQTVTSSMLKANASGQIIAAVGGTDYEYPLTFSSPLVRTTNTISMPAASTSVSGYLTSTDWNTFNNKGSGTVTSVSGTAPVVSSGGATPNISMAAATTSVSGYLTSTDWTTFNNKFTLPSLTQGSVLFSNGSTIAQNNNRLYWDNTNMRFGVGSQSVSQYVMYVAANVGENANAWLGIDNKNATGSTAVRLILNGSTTSGFQYVQSTNMTQVYANAGDIQLINGSSLGLTIANTSGNGTFSAGVRVTNDIFIGDTTTGTGRFFITDSSNQGITLRRTGATGDRFKMFVGNGTTYTQDNAIILGTNTDIDFYTGSSPVRRMTISNGGNIGIANNTPKAQLDVTGFNGNLRLYSASGVTNNSISSNMYWDGSTFLRDVSAGCASLVLHPTAGFIFNTTASTTGGPDERMRITAAGDMYLQGRSTNGDYGMYFYSNDTDSRIYSSNSGAVSKPLQFYTAGTERMRVTGTGRIYNSNAPANSFALEINGSTTTSQSYGMIMYAGSNSSDAAFLINNYNGTSTLFKIRGDGVFNTGNASLSPYNNGFTGRTAQIASNGELGYLSSTRESKSNIESIKNVDFINQLNPVQFNYRKKDNVTHKFTDELYNNISYGFIADEVEKVNKELAFYNEDGTLAGVEYNSMIAILTKAVQELKAEIEILKNK